MTEELKEQIHERVYNIKVPTLGFSRRDLFNIAMEYAEPREKRIAELEKENAELKSIADFQTSSNMDRYFQLKRSKEQLTKAKELLERLLITSCNSDVLNLLPNCSEVLRVRVEAEQFLKDSEVEK